MPRAIRSSLVLVTLAALLTYGFSTGPPVFRTGAFAVATRPAEGNCSVCHSGQTVNDPSGSLQLLDLPTAYIPGQLYTFRLQLSHAWSPLPVTPRWGFEMQAVLAATGDSAGVWQVTAADSYQVVKTTSTTNALRFRRYLEHKVGGIQEGQPGPVEWAVHWQAPPQDSGLVYFFAAANSADGTGSTSGDYIFTLVDSLPCAGPLGVDRPATPTIALAAPWPNPAAGATHLAFTLAQAGRATLGVYDAAGRQVRTVLDASLAAGPHVLVWDGTDAHGSKAPGGLYFARLRVNGQLAATRRIVRLGGS